LLTAGLDHYSCGAYPDAAAPQRKRGAQIESRENRLANNFNVALYVEPRGFFQERQSVGKDFRLFLSFSLALPNQTLLTIGLLTFKSVSMASRQITPKPARGGAGHFHALGCAHRARWGPEMRVLLIEDDSATAQSIELMLKSENFNVYTTDLGEEGIDLGKLYDYDIILLDLNLPDMSGYEVLRTLRVAKVKTPILILSGLAGIEDKVKGLGFGADDYLTKPFHKDELVARIHAIVRRSKGHAQSVIVTGSLTVNLDQKTVEVGGARVHLTGKEYQMLELLSLRKGTTLTKEMFLNHLYGGMDEPELKIIDVFICKLRKKLANASEGRNYIETVWGRGYVLREPTEAEERIPA
jgi:two-component system, cell cycle response regulator CtrA